MRSNMLALLKVMSQVPFGVICKSPRCHKTGDEPGIQHTMNDRQTAGWLAVLSRISQDS